MDRNQVESKSMRQAQAPKGKSGWDFFCFYKKASFFAVLLKFKDKERNYYSSHLHSEALHSPLSCKCFFPSERLASVRQAPLPQVHALSPFLYLTQCSTAQNKARTTIKNKSDIKNCAIFPTKNQLSQSLL